MAMHAVEMICECGIIAATMAVTIHSQNATMSTFLFLCASMAVAVVCFCLTIVNIAQMRRAATAIVRRVTASFHGMHQSAAGQQLTRQPAATHQIHPQPAEPPERSDVVALC